MPAHNPTTRVRSPFLIIPEFISPLTCENLVDEIDFNGFSTDPITHAPLKTIFSNKRCDIVIADALELYWDKISGYYAPLGGYESIAYEWFPEGYKSPPAAVDGYARVNQQWMRTSCDDLTVIVFLSEHNTRTPFDSDFEVLGGKLEFPTFGFGFPPKMGMAVVFPAAPNFIHGTANTQLGDLFQVRIRLTTDAPYRYDYRNFPGTFREWF